MEPKERHHFEWNTVKKSIIEFILTSSGPVSEPDVRDFLQREYGEQKKDGKFERSTVNKHLHKLGGLGGLGCIESVKLENKSKFKFWDIEFKNLKNIKEVFPDIKLKNSTKAKYLIIKINFPDNLRRRYKKYFIYMSLFPSLFDVFLNNDFKHLIKRADELWQIEDYKNIIDLKVDKVYNEIFLLDWVNPPHLGIEVSKEEFQMALDEIEYIHKDKNEEKQEEIINQCLLKNLSNIVLPKRPGSTEDQVKKEVSEKIINNIWGPYQLMIDDIVRYQYHRRHVIYDKVCKHFYETDFLLGNADEDAKFFIDELEKRIKKVNEIFNQTPTSEETQLGEKFQAAADKLDELYDEWYEKCLQTSIV